MKRSSKIVFTAALTALAMSATAPAFAEGGAINPNRGWWRWFVSLFSDEGSQLDPNGSDAGGAMDPNG